MEYLLNHIDVSDVQNESNRVLTALKTDDALREEARKAGVGLEELDAALDSEAPDKLIMVEPHGMGLGPAATAIIVAFAPVAAMILRDVWQYLILPRLRGVHGPDAVKPAAPRGDK